MRKITDVQFHLKGQGAGIDGMQWAEIRLSFTAGDDHVRDIAVSLLVSDDPEKTLLALHEESRDDAIETLKAALGALEQHGISDLAQQAAKAGRRGFLVTHDGELVLDKRVIDHGYAIHVPCSPKSVDCRRY